MNQKVALVASGGGMSCSYAAGAISALASFHKFETPDIALAGSGSVGTMAYYTSGQYPSLTGLWSRHLSTRKFINKLRFWKIIDIDYLIDDVFKKQDPLDTEAVKESDIEFLIPVTNVLTGDLTYFSNHDSRDPNDIFDFMRASKALPIAFNKRVVIDDVEYCDTYLSSYLQTHIKTAIERGATHIIAINNDMSRWFNEFLFGLWLKRQSARFKDNYQRKLREVLDFEIPDDISIVYIDPSKKLRVQTLNSTQNLLAEAIQMGHDDVVNSKDLRALLDSLA